MNFYIITFDRSLTAKYKSFHDDLVSPTEIVYWWHYVKSAYIIGTEWSVNKLSEHFRDTAKSHNIDEFHFITKIDLSHSQGWLVSEAWEWINKHA